ncbi:MAG: DUF2752 domain-containing protein [Bacteroidia bacterium]
MISTSSINKSNSFRKILGIVGALLTLTIPYFIMLHNKGGHIETEQSLCPFKLLTGFPCPGCGITKSLVFLYEGNLAKSFYYHLFGPFTFLFCCTAIIVLFLELITKKSFFQNILFNTKLAYFLGFLLASYHLIRLINFVATNTVDSILIQSVWK